MGVVGEHAGVVPVIYEYSAPILVLPAGTAVGLVVEIDKRNFNIYSVRKEIML